MSRKLTAFVSLWDDDGKVVTLVPGDELPDWAEGRIGDHCLTSASESTDAEDESNEDPDGADSQREDGSSADDSGAQDEAEDVAEESAPAAKPKATAAPDFTGSAPRRRQSRK